MKRNNKDIIIAVIAASAIASVCGNLSRALALHTGAPASFFHEAFTCHLVHWTQEHLFYDAVCFAVMASIIHRRNLLAAMLLCAPAIALTVSLSRPELEMYGGLSGVNCALYPIAIWELLGAERPHMAAVAIIAAIAKTAMESRLGCTFFATSGFEPIHEAHIAGLAAGCLAAGISHPCHLPRCHS